MFYLSDLVRRSLYGIALVCIVLWAVLVFVTKAGAESYTQPAHAMSMQPSAHKVVAVAAPEQIAGDAFNAGPRAAVDVATAAPTTPPAVLNAGTNMNTGGVGCDVPDPSGGPCTAGGSRQSVESGLALYAVSPGGKEPLAAVRDGGVNRYVTTGDRIHSGLVIIAITDDGVTLSNGQRVGFVRATAAAPIAAAAPDAGTPASGMPERITVPPVAVPAASAATVPVDPAYLQNLQSRYPGIAFPSTVPAQTQPQAGTATQSIPQPQNYLQSPSTSGTPYLQQYGNP
jgi:hypothetical protein